jgi:hypothetical protein
MAKRKRWVHLENYDGWVWVIGKEYEASTITFKADRPCGTPPGRTKGHWARMKVVRAKLDE